MIWVKQCLRQLLSHWVVCPSFHEKCVHCHGMLRMMELLGERMRILTCIWVFSVMWAMFSHLRGWPSITSTAKWKLQGVRTRFCRWTKSLAMKLPVSLSASLLRLCLYSFTIKEECYSSFWQKTEKYYIASDNLLILCSWMLVKLVMMTLDVQFGHSTWINDAEGLDEYNWVAWVHNCKLLRQAVNPQH